MYTAPRRPRPRPTLGDGAPYQLSRRSSLIGDGALGFVDPATAYAAYKTGSSIVHTVEGFFGNDDAKRQQRIDWFVDNANRNSVIAANVIVAAPDNVGGNEAKQWRTALGKVSAAVLARTAPGGYWPSSDPDWNMTATRQLVLNELAGNGSMISTPTLVPSSPTPSASSPFTPVSATTGQMLPAMRTTAPFNYMPVIAGVVGGGLLLMALNGNRERR